MHISLPEALDEAQATDAELANIFQGTTASGWRSSRFTAGTYLDNAKRLQPDHARTSPKLSDGKCSTLSTVLAISEQERQQNLFPSDSCGRACRRTAAPGHERPSIASGRRYPGTRTPHWEISLCLFPGSSTCTSTSLAHFRLQTAQILPYGSRSLHTLAGSHPTTGHYGGFPVMDARKTSPLTWADNSNRCCFTPWPACAASVCPSRRLSSLPPTVLWSGCIDHSRPP